MLVSLIDSSRYLMTIFFQNASSLGSAMNFAESTKFFTVPLKTIPILPFGFVPCQWP